MIDPCNKPENVFFFGSGLRLHGPVEIIKNSLQSCPPKMCCVSVQNAILSIRISIKKNMGVFPSIHNGYFYRYFHTFYLFRCTLIFLHTRQHIFYLLTTVFKWWVAFCIQNYYQPIFFSTTWSDAKFIVPEQDPLQALLAWKQNITGKKRP